MLATVGGASVQAADTPAVRQWRQQQRCYPCEGCIPHAHLHNHAHSHAHPSPTTQRTCSQRPVAQLVKGEERDAAACRGQEEAGAR